MLNCFYLNVGGKLVLVDYNVPITISKIYLPRYSLFLLWVTCSVEYGGQTQEHFDFIFSAVAELSLPLSSSTSPPPLNLQWFCSSWVLSPGTNDLKNFIV